MFKNISPHAKNEGKRREKPNVSNVVSLAAFKEEREKMGVQRRGKSWEVVVDVGDRYQSGRKKYHREGGFVNKKEAKQREYELLQQRQQRLMQPVQDQVKTLFHDVATEWLLKKKDDIRFSTWKRYEEIMRKHIVPFFQGSFIEDLSKKDIQEYYDVKKASCRQSMGKHRAVINQVFEMAVERRIIQDNIARLARLPRMRETTKSWITEQEELVNFVKTFEDSCMYVPILIAACTGMRMSEITALTWQDIVFKYKYVAVDKSRHFHIENGGSYEEKTKTPKSTRKVALADNVLQILSSIKKDRNAKQGDFVCLNSAGTVFRNNTLSTNFRRAARATMRGGYNISFKSLRSSYATILRDMGVDEVVIQEELGHAQLTTTQNHYFVTTPHQREKLQNAKKEIFNAF